MARKYGTPYKGSKSAIADWIVDNLPEADTLVDLFAGGGGGNRLRDETRKI